MVPWHRKSRRTDHSRDGRLFQNPPLPIESKARKQLAQVKATECAGESRGEDQTETREVIVHQLGHGLGASVRGRTLHIRLVFRLV